VRDGGLYEPYAPFTIRRANSENWIGRSTDPGIVRSARLCRCRGSTSLLP